MKTLTLILLLFTVLFCLPALADDDTPHPAENTQRFYRELLASKPIYTGAALLVDGAGEKFNGTIGFADANLPWHPDMPFYVASIGKTFMAVAVMQLWDRGLLGLDDTLTRWLEPEISGQLAAADRITVRQLLNHTAGLKDATGQPAFVVDILANPGKTWSDEEVLTYIYGEELWFEPGSRHGYTDTNYILLAMIIQRVTGEHASVMVRQGILEPLDLQHTYYLVHEGDGSDMVHGFAFGDPLLGAGAVDTQPWAKGLAIGAAPLVSTTEDIARFFRALLKDKTLLSREARQQMLQNNLVNIGVTNIESYGFGLNRSDWGNNHSYWHDGGFPGHYSIVQYFPKYDLVVAGLFNFTLGDRESHIQPSRLIFQEILTAVLARVDEHDRD